MKKFKFLKIWRSEILGEFLVGDSIFNLISGGAEVIFVKNFDFPA